MTRPVRRAAIALATILAFAMGCGETRSPIGDECLRGEDCLSGVCSARLCVAAPPLVMSTGPAPPDETVDIPDEDAAAPRDASSDG